ncbi:hypothetical protein KIF24_08225 [Micromonospora sp. Llam7]|uniref:hypothetical protein n=1 Tax=Micromonospora tarapacensis TaxID=2835305 RepID=UPI001C83B5ED|nr:hypothetical protein [Micromonospora tarapacensis]MBX7264728.1 hypothetical protein [Micromonospora tarapacensis]MBX7266015.1 hypothetical protein [Micromonospora tarapacensis]
MRRSLPESRQAGSGVGDRLVGVAVMSREVAEARAHLCGKLMIPALDGHRKGIAEVPAGRFSGTSIMRHPPGHLVERGDNGDHLLVAGRVSTQLRQGDPLGEIGSHGGVQVSTADAAIGHPDRVHEV